ncbi:MAG TPA: hypothetical protein VIL48_20215 [Acidimicrobiales bacterium]
MGAATIPIRPFLVDPASARRVAAAFAEAPSAPHDPLVRAAYADLSAQADRLFALLTGAGAAHRVRVALTRRPEPYADAAELTESVRAHRVLEVEPVADDHDRRHPLLDPAPGGAHDRFRAVHDILSHGWAGHDFGRHGELSAWLNEDRLYTGLARWALATELHAHHSVRWTTGELAPYKAALLDPRILRASQRAARHAPAAALA